MKALYIAWQEPKVRMWHTVGRLTCEGDGYRFDYTQGALEAPGFTYLGRMMDLHKSYHSMDLFPLFANRLLNRSRPEYPEYLKWLGVDQHADSMELLARSGGERATDKLCVYAEPEANKEGMSELYFFSHGLRYLSDESQQRIATLHPGEPLHFAKESSNTHDRYALVLETGDPTKVGYCPNYLSQNFHRVMDGLPIQLSVEKVNNGAPSQFRLLCKATFNLEKNSELFIDKSHNVLTETSVAA